MRLPRLTDHEGKALLRRYRRGHSLVRSTVVVQSYPRWVCFVHNSYASAVVLTSKFRRGACTCRDFQKTGRTCKHIYASVLRVIKDRFDSSEPED